MANITEIIKDARKNYGVHISRATANVNNKPAYKIEGRPGLYTKAGVMVFIEELHVTTVY